MGSANRLYESRTLIFQPHPSISLKDDMTFPQIIQGGMGVGVSHWKLARAVSMFGQLGVVSGLALEVCLARKLQKGDPEGVMRGAMAAFPVKAWVDEILEAYWIPGGKPQGKPFKPVPLYSLQPPPALAKLTIVANFAEIFLAKQGHDGLVGVNLLEKIQLPTIFSLYGAMLAKVDYVLMGAGIPRFIPGVLDELAGGKAVRLPIDVTGALPGDDFHSEFDPVKLGIPRRALKRPKFLPIVSSATLAMALVRKANGRVDGFVVEGATAGGHNAPPRGALRLNERGEPIYGPKDNPEIEKIQALGLPFWLAGSYGVPGRLEEALQKGATGIQVGTAFAFCDESGIDPDLKAKVIEKSRKGRVDIYTDPLASPTGFPFKILQMEGSLSEEKIASARIRVCDLGYLREVYRKGDGSPGYRCPGEPLRDYLSKGGEPVKSEGKKCLCNGLSAAVRMGQIQRGGEEEPFILTAGDDAVHVSRFLTPGKESYSAADVIKSLFAGGPPCRETVDPAEGKIFNTNKPMSLQIITPKVRGFICTNAHPAGCARNVIRQISHVREQKLDPSQPLNVLIVGASTGYGLASRIVAAFGYKARTIGVFHERSPDGEKTATAGYYNTAAFHREAEQGDLYAVSFNGDAFSDEMKGKVIDRIRADMGGIDYLIYSLASPRRTHPRTGKLHGSVIKPIGEPFVANSVDVNTGMVHMATIQPASESEITDTQQVMGGEDWKFWIEALGEQGLLRPGIRSVAYSYIGPEQTWPVYRSGTIGRAKDHLESTAQELDDILQETGGNAWVSINKAVVTQSSAAIPVVPLYLAILYPLMRQWGIHEDCIEQMTRLFSEQIGPGWKPVLDDRRRIRLDDREMQPVIQSAIADRWKAFRPGEALPEFSSYRQEFRRLFGFDVPGVDYTTPVEIAPACEWDLASLRQYVLQA